MNNATFLEALKQLAADVHSQLSAWRQREKLGTEDPADDTVDGIERHTRDVYRRSLRERERLRLVLTEIEERQPFVRAESQLHRDTIDADLATLAVELGALPPRLPDW